MAKSPDFIIIGAGSSGAYLSYLLVNNGWKVRVIDQAENMASPFFLRPPILAAYLLNNPRFASTKNTADQTHLAGRSVPYFSSNLVGGLAEMNGAVCFAGHRLLYEKAFGDTLFASSAVVENLRAAGEGFSSEIYKSRRSAWNSPISEEFRGYFGGSNKNNTDFDLDIEGAGFIKNNANKFGRNTAARLFLNCFSSGLLDYQGSSKVRSLEIDGSRVKSILMADDSRLDVNGARVILCAGAIGSPEILLRSGVGEKESLKNAGVVQRVNLPGVGNNLRDHPNIRVPFFSRSFQRDSIGSRGIRRVFDVFSYLTGKASYLSSSGASSAFSFFSDGGKDLNNLVRIQLVHFSLAQVQNRVSFKPDPNKNFSLSVSLVVPRSSGRVSLDKFSNVRVDPGYLDDADDVRNMIAGVDKARGFVEHVAKKDGESLQRNGDVPDKADNLSRNVSTGYHMIGSCSVGDDPGKYVCNRDLQVKGVDDLFVCDASVFPSHISTNTYFPCLMLADYLASIMRGR